MPPTHCCPGQVVEWNLNKAGDLHSDIVSDFNEQPSMNIFLLKSATNY